MINVGIGFVTGRKHFQKLLSTYINNWNEHGLISNKKIRLHLFINYDLNYFNTTRKDYTRLDPEIADMVDSINFLGQTVARQEVAYLIREKVLTKHEAQLIFGEGYGKKRNLVTYFALKNKMDYLLFIDDDEYPVAVIKHEQTLWCGQSILSTHLKHIADFDMTHGRHCGYISPIPTIQFNDVLTEDQFRKFIEAISNDIITWDSIKTNLFENKGVTYADLDIIQNKPVETVAEVNGMKFISGANLCFNMKHIAKIAPFYNPPDARGEDTFLSTCLTDVNVCRVPCYTFHDGFLNYSHILHGVLPKNLTPVKFSRKIAHRFIRATIGWIRYKPLLLYITERNDYQQRILQMEQDLIAVIPSLCAYFNTREFEVILKELAHYHQNVRRHFRSFQQTRKVWTRVVKFTSQTISESAVVVA